MVDYTHAEQYTLSIRVSTDGLCFAVHHPERTEEYAYHPYEVDPLLPVVANLREAQEALSLLRHRYGKVQVLLADTPCAVVPREYDAVVSPCPEKSRPLTATLPTGEVLRFNADEALFRWVHEALSPTLPVGRTDGVGDAVSYIPGLYSVLRFAFCSAVSSTDAGGSELPFVLCHLHGRLMDIVCIRDGKLSFVNTFDSSCAANALYYLMGTWQMLGLSQLNDVLTLVGRSACLREFRAKANRFIRHINEPRPADLFHATELARLAAVPFDLQTLVNGLP